ncbi:MAG TPA: hypothetical protein VEZ50_16660 [Nodosilinea sp.]|nr:hypothetical protein [Nodosilinea sp.]
MSRTLTIEIPGELDRRLVLEAERRQIPLEDLVLQFIAQSFQAFEDEVDEDDEPKELVLKSLRASLQDIEEGKILPIEDLWNGIDD